MQTNRIDKTYFTASKMERDGNADYRFWFDKTIDERLAAAATMIAVSFKEPDFLIKKVDKTFFTARKHSN